jgi:hypothetical protein
MFVHLDGVTDRDSGIDGCDYRGFIDSRSQPAELRMQKHARK